MCRERLECGKQKYAPSARNSYAVTSAVPFAWAQNNLKIIFNALGDDGAQTKWIDRHKFRCENVSVQRNCLFWHSEWTINHSKWTNHNFRCFHSQNILIPLPPFICKFHIIFVIHLTMCFTSFCYWLALDTVSADNWLRNTYLAHTLNTLIDKNGICHAFGRFEWNGIRSCEHLFESNGTSNRQFIILMHLHLDEQHSFIFFSQN